MLPVEVLAYILEYLPREKLAALTLTSPAFRYAIGLIARREWCKHLKSINKTIDLLKQSLECGANLQDQVYRSEICQKIGYERIIKMKLDLIATVIEKYAYDNNKWIVISPAILNILLQLDDLHKNVLNNRYFVKDIRPKFVNVYATRIHSFLDKYFTEIEPVLRYKEKDKMHHIQLFNILTFCKSANTRIVAFHTSKCDYSIVSLFFQVGGLGQQSSIHQFNQYSDKNTPDEEKLVNLKKYFLHILEQENSQYLFYLLEEIINLENNIDFPSSGLINAQVLHQLQNTYETFLFKTYNEPQIEKTKLTYKNIYIYRHEISRQHEFKLTVSKVECNLKFCCARQQLPKLIEFNEDDTNSYRNSNEFYVEMLSEYFQLQDNIFKKPKLDRFSESDGTAMNLNVSVNHNSSPKSIIVVINELIVKISKNQVQLKVSTDNTISRFDGLQCECEANGNRCHAQSSLLLA